MALLPLPHHLSSITKTGQQKDKPFLFHLLGTPDPGQQADQQQYLVSHKLDSLLYIVIYKRYCIMKNASHW
jgi:hypothetical protein